MKIFFVFFFLLICISTANAQDLGFEFDSFNPIRDIEANSELVNDATESFFDFSCKLPGFFGIEVSASFERLLHFGIYSFLSSQIALISHELGHVRIASQNKYSWDLNLLFMFPFGFVDGYVDFWAKKIDFNIAAIFSAGGMNQSVYNSYVSWKNRNIFGWVGLLDPIKYNCITRYIYSARSDLRNYYIYSWHSINEFEEFLDQHLVVASLNPYFYYSLYSWFEYIDTGQVNEIPKGLPFIGAYLIPREIFINASILISDYEFGFGVGDGSFRVEWVSQEIPNFEIGVAFSYANDQAGYALSFTFDPGTIEFVFEVFSDEIFNKYVMLKESGVFFSIRSKFQ